jgi:hypothetical protein
MHDPTNYDVLKEAHRKAAEQKQAQEQEQAQQKQQAQKSEPYLTYEESYEAELLAKKQELQAKLDAGKITPQEFVYEERKFSNQRLAEMNTVEQQKDDRLKTAAADLLKETTPPHVISEAEYLAKPEVRKEWREQQEAQQLKEIERNAALDRMGADRAAGKEINHKDLSHLNHADLQSIKDRGEAALQELIQQRQQELERQRERDRLTREFQQNGREITRHS